MDNRLPLQQRRARPRTINWPNSNDGLRKRNDIDSIRDICAFPTFSFLLLLSKHAYRDEKPLLFIHTFNFLFTRQIPLNIDNKHWKLIVSRAQTETEKVDGSLLAL